MNNPIPTILVALSLMACGGEPFGADFSADLEGGAAGAETSDAGEAGSGDMAEAGAGHGGTASGSGGKPTTGGKPPLGGAQAGGSAGSAGAPQGGSAGSATAGSGGTTAGHAGTDAGGTSGTAPVCTVAPWENKTYQVGEAASAVCRAGCPEGEVHRFVCTDAFFCPVRDPGGTNGWEVAWDDQGICE